MKSISIAFLISVFSLPLFSFAQTPRPLADEAQIMENGLITLRDQVPRYYEYFPAQQGKPVIVLTNGLVYDLQGWDSFTRPLLKQGYGVLRYYFRGQHQTLLAETKAFKKPLFFQSGLEGQDFVDELAGLLDKLKINDKVVVVGLSYGSHIAARFAEKHPEKISQLVMMAPLVQSLEKYDPAGAWVLQSLEWIKLSWGPFLGQYFYEAAYRQIYQSYFKQRLIPELIPVELRGIAEIYRESVFHLVRAVRDFDLRRYNFAKLDTESVSYFIPNEVEPQAGKDQRLAAKAVAPGRLRNIIYMPESAHAIPGSQGEPAAGILHLILSGDQSLKPGQSLVYEKGQLNPGER